jgi:hypothetical protein
VAQAARLGEALGRLERPPQTGPVLVAFGPDALTGLLYRAFVLQQRDGQLAHLTRGAPGATLEQSLVNLVDDLGRTLVTEEADRAQTLGETRRVVQAALEACRPACDTHEPLRSHTVTTGYPGAARRILASAGAAAGAPQLLDVDETIERLYALPTSTLALAERALHAAGWVKQAGVWNPATKPLVDEPWD